MLVMLSVRLDEMEGEMESRLVLDFVAGLFPAKMRR